SFPHDALPIYWKYTDLRLLMREVLPLAPEPDAAALTRAAAALKLHAIEGVRRLVLLDGMFVPDLSDTANLEKGLRIRTLREALEAGETGGQLFAPENSDAMLALNGAMMTDGLLIEIADGAAIPQPLHIVHVATGPQPAAIFTRSLLNIGSSATTTLVESYIAGEGSKASQVLDSFVVWIGDGAPLDHVRLVEDGGEPFNISPPSLPLGATALYNSLGMT